MKTTEPIKNESESKRKHLWLIQSWHWAMIAESPIGLFKKNPHQHQRSRHSQRKDQDSGNTLTQITDDLVALHIGYNPKLTSATMLVDSGASHILVRQEHIHVLKDVGMSAPNTKSFASLKSAKKGAELSLSGVAFYK